VPEPCTEIRFGEFHRHASSLYPIAEVDISLIAVGVDGDLHPMERHMEKKAATLSVRHRQRER
jgi:hypothetical protein